MLDLAWSTELLLPSRRGATRGVLNELLRQLHQHDWTEQEIFGVHLAVEEALVNAIKHGNQLDDQKSVRFRCRLSPRRLWVEVSDEGSGFQLCDVPDCTADENLHLPSGRGIMLMRSFMNRVEYNDQGNLVVMEKERANNH